jgi:L-cysteine S-thiosulfotransferase
MQAAGMAMLLAATMLGACSSPAQQSAAPDFSQALTQESASAERGRALVASRQQGLCLLCHAAPIAEEPLQGNLAPPLHGVGARLSAAQLRQRMIDSRQIDPQSIMPAYFSAQGFTQVASIHQGRTIFSAQQIEDVVAYLQTLK